MAMVVLATGAAAAGVTHVCVFQDAGWLGDVLGQVDSRMHDYVMLLQMTLSCSNQ